MARFSNVIIRTKERLDNMGELGDILKTVGQDKSSIQIPDEGEEVPLVYQFSKGKKNGETLDATPDKIIGGVTNIRIDPDTGNLIGDVRLSPMMRLSEHYKGTVDNMVVGKTIPLEDGDVATDREPIYEVMQLIVYDKMITKQKNSIEVGNSLVEKTYDAPTEFYEVPPDVGERLKTTLNKMNKDLDKATDPSSGWRGREVSE